MARPPEASWDGARPSGTRGCPPGQYDAGRTWPVLTAEATPQLDTATWTFTVEGLVETPTRGPGTRSGPCRRPPTRATSTA